MTTPRAARQSADERDAEAEERDEAARLIEFWDKAVQVWQRAADERRAAAADRDAVRELLPQVMRDRRAAAADRLAAAKDRLAAAKDRLAAAGDREAAQSDREAESAARQQAAVERAEETAAGGRRPGPDGLKDRGMAGLTGVARASRAAASEGGTEFPAARLSGRQDRRMRDLGPQPAAGGRRGMWLSPPAEGQLSRPGPRTSTARSSPTAGSSPSTRPGTSRWPAWSSTPATAPRSPARRRPRSSASSDARLPGCRKKGVGHRRAGPSALADRGGRAVA
jgi:hypothetical protein